MNLMNLNLYCAKTIEKYSKALKLVKINEYNLKNTI